MPAKSKRKRVHPATVARIIREHESKTRIVVGMAGMVVLDMPLAMLRDVSTFRGGTPSRSGEIVIHLREKIEGSGILHWKRVNNS